MAGPLDAVTAIHNAFRRDMSGIDAAALGLARGEPGLTPTFERFRFFNEVLVWHAHGVYACAKLPQPLQSVDHHPLRFAPAFTRGLGGL